MNIAISGKMATGKSTLARCISREYEAEKLAIADKLKQIGALHTQEALEDIDKLARDLTEEVVDLCPKKNITDFGKIVIAVVSIFYKYEPVEGKNRALLQALGHDLHEFEDDLWIKYLLEKKALLYDSVVIDDVRYPVELDRLRQADYITVRLETDEIEQRRRLLNLYGEVNEEWLNHPSETLLDNARFDIVIDNTNLTVEETFEELNEQLKAQTLRTEVIL